MAGVPTGGTDAPLAGGGIKRAATAACAERTKGPGSGRERTH